MIAYFGPMVVHDGAVLTFGLAASASFVASWHRPSAGANARTLSLYFVATQLDFLGHLWGVSLFALALVAPDRRRALRLVAAAFAVSVASLAIVCLHYATIFGSPFEYLRMMIDVSRQADARAPDAAAILSAIREVLIDYGN